MPSIRGGHRRREEHGLPASRASRRGSPRCPRRSPCRASRRPRRAPRSASAVEVERAAAEVVEGPARGRDDDVDAALERPELAAERLPAVDRQDARAERAAVAVRRPRRPASPARGSGTRIERAGRAPVRRRSSEPLEQRQREGGRLARPGRRLPEQVAALEQRRDRLPLDRRRLLVAEGRQCREQLGPKAQLAESVVAHVAPSGTAVRPVSQPCDTGLRPARGVNPPYGPRGCISALRDASVP